MPKPKPSEQALGTFAGLRRVVATLRGPGGCPWDRAQTHETLRPWVAEEAYEVLAAIDEGEPEKLQEELGDLLFQVLIHAQLAEEAGQFTIRDVIYGLADKLVRRHPHVFGESTAATPGAVIEQWDDLKRKERGDGSALAGIAHTLPALAYAQAVQRRAARAGFRWESAEQVWEALRGELDELREARGPDEQRRELGDALFALVNLAREYDVDAEDALREAASRFGRRFTAMEGMVRERGIDLEGAALTEKLALWEEAKARG